MRAHPFLRGLSLAFALCAAMVLWGSFAVQPVFRIAQVGRPLAAFAVMTVAGAFLAAVPSRIRRRNGPYLRSTWRGCLVAFAAGLVLMIGAHIAGMDDVEAMSGMLQGGMGALAFGGTAWCTALVTSRLIGRWRA